KRRRPEDKTSRVYGQQNVRQAEPRAGRAQKRGPSFRRASADICLFALGLSAALALVPGPVAGTTAAGTALAGFSLTGGGSGLLPGRPVSGGFLLGGSVSGGTDQRFLHLLHLYGAALTVLFRTLPLLAPALS